VTNINMGDCNFDYCRNNLRFRRKERSRKNCKFVFVRPKNKRII